MLATIYFTILGSSNLLSLPSLLPKYVSSMTSRDIAYKLKPKIVLTLSFTFSNNIQIT